LGTAQPDGDRHVSKGVSRRAPTGDQTTARERTDQSKRAGRQLEAGQVPAGGACHRGCAALLRRTVAGMRGAAIPSLSIVLPTHDRPDALEAVLWALSQQSDRRFEVVVAADGSDVDTAATVERWRSSGFGESVRYVHQEREG